MSNKVLRYAGAAFLVLLLVAQFIQPDRVNPPGDPGSSFEAVGGSNPKAAAVFQRACYNCHSFNTHWPWYSRIAPVSWLVADDVAEGRTHLNFSRWKSLGLESARMKLKDACEEVSRDDMPPWIYRLVHPEARLTAEDVKAICDAAPGP